MARSNEPKLAHLMKQAADYKKDYQPDVWAGSTGLTIGSATAGSTSFNAATLVSGTTGGSARG